MLFLSADDFQEKVSAIRPLSRKEELDCALRMAGGDGEARSRLIEGYLPQAAGSIRSLPERYRTLEAVMRCCAAVEKAVDRFDFLQDGERFSHRLSWWLRQTVTGYMADARNQ